MELWCCWESYSTTCKNVMLLEAANDEPFKGCGFHGCQRASLKFSLAGRRWICKARWIAWQWQVWAPSPETDMSPARGWLGKWVSCSTGGYIVNWRAYIQKLWLLDRCYLAQLVDETSTFWLTRLGPAQSVSIEKALEERECESKWSLYTQATELEMIMKKVQVHLQWYSMHCLSIFL